MSTKITLDLEAIRYILAQNPNFEIEVKAAMLAGAIDTKVSSIASQELHKLILTSITKEIKEHIGYIGGGAPFYQPILSLSIEKEITNKVASTVSDLVSDIIKQNIPDRTQILNICNEYIEYAKDHIKYEIASFINRHINNLTAELVKATPDLKIGQFNLESITRAFSGATSGV